jgi:hypothetical protein
MPEVSQKYEYSYSINFPRGMSQVSAKRGLDIVSPPGGSDMKCPSCGYDNPEGAQYCSLCQTSFIKGQLQSTESVKPPAPTGHNKKPEELSWFQRHLNWTWVFVHALFVLSVVIIGIILYLTARNSYLSFGEVLNSFVLIRNILAILGNIISFGVGAWVLYRKDRSYAWLLLYFAPFGVIFFLLIRNHHDYPALPKYHAARTGIEPRSKPSW